MTRPRIPGGSLSENARADMSAGAEVLFITAFALVSALLVAMTLVVVWDEVKRNYNPADGEQWWMHRPPMARPIN